MATLKSGKIDFCSFVERLGPCVLPRRVPLNVGFRRSVRGFPDFECLVCALLRAYF